MLQLTGCLGLDNRQFLVVLITLLVKEDTQLTKPQEFMSFSLYTHLQGQYSQDQFFWFYFFFFIEKCLTLEMYTTLPPGTKQQACFHRSRFVSFFLFSLIRLYTYIRPLLPPIYMIFCSLMMVYLTVMSTSHLLPL